MVKHSKEGCENQKMNKYKQENTPAINVYKKAIANMTLVFDCKKAFNREGLLTQKSSAVINRILKLLKIAFVLSEGEPEKSYNAYYAIFNIAQITQKRNIVTDNIDNQMFPALTKSRNFSLLKENLTAFQLEPLEKMAHNHDIKGAHTYFVNKFNIDKLISMGKRYSPYYTLSDLFQLLDCHKPFLIVPKVINKNTDNERTEYLTHSGLKSYNKLISIINHAHNTFDYPDIIDALDSIVDREWY